MEIVQERLEREFDLDLIASAPSVEYHVVLTNGRGVVAVDNPARLPSPTDIEEIEEPWVKLSVVTPSAVHRRRSWSSRRTGAGRSSTWSTSTRTASCCTSRCRWPS